MSFARVQALDCFSEEMKGEKQVLLGLMLQISGYSPSLSLRRSLPFKFC